MPRFALLCFALCLPVAIAQAAPQPDKELEALIDKLTEVSELGFGYSSTFSGSQFLPQRDSDEVGTLVLGRQAPARSAVLEKIVAKGAPAMPLLLKHLDDTRKTRIKPVRGMMWMSFADEYDFNRRTRKDWPKRVNRDTFGEKQPDSHQLTVGDLCFVVLGQVVNRRFNASRYQPTGGLVISSPTYSKKLCDVARQDFKDFTVEKHRKMLRKDFLLPDYEDRRIGAYRRLAFYYPAEVEQLVLKQLAVPTYDVFIIEEFVRHTLYREKRAAKRKELFTQFIGKHGPAFRDGKTLLQLFDDLDTQEADEEKRLSPPLKEKYDARALLVELFGYKPAVKSKDVPFVDTWPATQQARFLKALVHDKSKKIDTAVFAIFHKVEDDDYLAVGCMNRLVGRGYDEHLRSIASAGSARTNPVRNSATFWPD